MPELSHPPTKATCGLFVAWLLRQGETAYTESCRTLYDMRPGHRLYATLDPVRLCHE
jgi:hypothetical protein